MQLGEAAVRCSIRDGNHGRGCDHGLGGMNGFIDVGHGGSIGAALQKANFSQVHKAAIDAGLVTDEVYAEVMRNLDDPSFSMSHPR